MVHTGLSVTGLKGCDTRDTFSSGEQAHGAYCVRTRETVLASETASWPPGYVSLFLLKESSGERTTPYKRRISEGTK